MHACRRDRRRLPLPNRRSSTSSSRSRTRSGKKRLPPPTTTGQTNSWYSSTSPAVIAWAPRVGPPTVRSRSAAAFSCRTAPGSKSGSIRVLVVAAAGRVVEYTTLSAACQMAANSCVPGDWAAAAGSVSQTAISWYSRRPYR
jgi:hypothetical protein